MRRVGVIALQGDFDKHSRAVERCGADPVEVRTPIELASVDSAILPGGESTTVGLLMRRFGMDGALIGAANAGMPIWGTCMGMIMMAKTIVGRPDQFSLGILNISVERNAFGAQVHSFQDSVAVTGIDGPVMGVFIRSPIATDLGPGVESIATFQGKTVAVRQGKLLGTSFHPELTDDLRMHRLFLSL